MNRVRGSCVLACSAHSCTSLHATSKASVVAKHFPDATFTEYGASVPGWRDHCSPTTSGFNDGNVSMPAAGVTPDNSAAPIPSAGTRAAAQSPSLYMDVSDGLAQTLKQYYDVKVRTCHCGKLDRQSS